jgi:hypothetical protein
LNETILDVFNQNFIIKYTKDEGTLLDLEEKRSRTYLVLVSFFLLRIGRNFELED